MKIYQSKMNNRYTKRTHSLHNQMTLCNTNFFKVQVFNSLQLGNLFNLLYGRYIEWSSHEGEVGLYDFSGWNNITDFVKKAQDEGLLVILRPGPYIDSERDMVRIYVFIFE